MKKKILSLIIAITALFVIGTSAYAATYVNNEDVSNEVFTTISNNYTLFPVRYLGEKLGCEVYWNPDDKCITVSKGDIHRDFYNGSPVVYDWSGNSYSLVTVPMLVDGNTMVPVEFYGDHFGVSVLWDEVTSSLFVNSEDTYNWLINTEEYKNHTQINKSYEALLNSGAISSDSYGTEINDIAILIHNPTDYQRNLINITDKVVREHYDLDGDIIIVPKYSNSNIEILKVHAEKMGSSWATINDGVVFERKVDSNGAVELICNLPEIWPDNQIVVTDPEGNRYEYTVYYNTR